MRGPWTVEVDLSISSFAQGEQAASPAWEPSKADCVLGPLCENTIGWVSTKVSETFALTLKGAEAQLRVITFYQQHSFLGLALGAFRSRLALEVLQSNQSISVNASQVFQVLIKKSLQDFYLWKWVENRNPSNY